MTKQELEQLEKQLIIDGRAVAPEAIEVVETHISYLLLIGQEVYKIKKTVQLPFLDFSELQYRKHACSQELLLNKRLAPEMYLDVESVRQYQDQLIINGSKGKVIDYAVRMRRMDRTQEMDKMLEQRQVTTAQMEAVAQQVSSFHLQAFPVKKTWNASHLQATYNQLQEWAPVAKEKLGTSYQEIIIISCQLSDDFLSANVEHVNQRSRAGMVRDVHGDLHSHNIFLTQPPVIFDCIEFDDDLRQIDVLNEIAFFLMDLDYFDASSLGGHFLKHYLKHLEGTGLADAYDEPLLIYFKMYRASVRAKIMLIRTADDEKQASHHLHQAAQYLKLVQQYASLLEKQGD